MSITEMNAMNLLTNGVYVIGTNNGSKMNVMTAAWVTQISSKPNMLLLAVGETHYTSELIRENRSFSVSILKEKQRDIAIACGFSSGRDTDKLKDLGICLSDSGNPMVKGAAAHLDCELTDTFIVADHVLFAAKVVKSEVFSSDVLVYTEGDFF